MPRGKPLCNTLISRAKKGVFRFAKMAGPGGRRDAAAPQWIFGGLRTGWRRRAISLLTGKLSRKPRKFRTIAACLRGFGSRLPSGFNGLQPIPCSSGNHEFCVPEQGFRPAEQGRNREYAGCGGSLCSAKVQIRGAAGRAADGYRNGRCCEAAGSWRTCMISNGWQPGGFVLPKWCASGRQVGPSPRGEGDVVPMPRRRATPARLDGRAVAFNRTIA
jgi:hypothetical protein